jgi:hypothetical protein
MKKTLYEILGVDPKASPQEIEAAYIARIDELKFATLQDPNKLRVLQQSKEILSDANQRATYDASIAVRATPESYVMEEYPEPTFLEQWGKWIAAGVVVIAAVLWWASHRVAPPPKPPTPQAAAGPAPASPAPASPTPAPASETVEPAAQTNAVNAVAAVPLPAAAPVNAVMGEWSCDDAISGHTSKYNFQQSGALGIVTSDGHTLEYKYELEGKSLKVTDPKQSSIFTIEEMAATKMILNTGAGGQRVVCKR